MPPNGERAASPEAVVVVEQIGHEHAVARRQLRREQRLGGQTQRNR